MNAPLHSLNGHQTFEAVTCHNAVLMMNGIVDDIMRSNANNLPDTLRAVAPHAASLCEQGWFDGAEVYEKLERAAFAGGNTEQVRGILLGAFAHIHMPFPPSDEVAKSRPYSTMPRRKRWARAPRGARAPRRA